MPASWGSQRLSHLSCIATLSRRLGSRDWPAARTNFIMSRVAWLGQAGAGNRPERQQYAPCTFWAIPDFPSVSSTVESRCSRSFASGKYSDYICTMPRSSPQTPHYCLPETARQLGSTGPGVHVPCARAVCPLNFHMPDRLPRSSGILSAIYVWSHTAQQSLPQLALGVNFGPGAVTSEGLYPGITQSVTGCMPGYV